MAPTNNPYDLIIVGAGINGAGVFRDAALNNLNVLLLDTKDPCTQTSSKSSKMLHGGIRYLKTFDFDLVAGALQEKNLWLEMAPHLTRLQSFVLPIYKNSPVSIFELGFGLKLYDLLSKFKKPHTKLLSSQKALEFVPLLNANELRGAGLYFDGVVDDKGLTLACINSALKSSKAKLSTQTTVKNVKIHGDLVEVTVEHLGSTKVLFSHDLCFCTGPFTDDLLPRLGIPWKNTLALSKGSHLWIKKQDLNLNHAVVMQDKSGRVIFAIPYPDKTLVGTTELPLVFTDPLFDIQISPQEIEYLLDRLREYFPKATVTSQSILATFCGIRPLVNLKANSGLGEISRHHHLFHPHPQITVLLGGKYTTFRTMCQDVLHYLCKRQNKVYNSLKTLSPL